LSVSGFVVVQPVTRSVFTQEYDRFRRLLVEARKTVGLTQAELAARLSRPQSFISKIERGERRLDVVEFFEVAQALGINAIQFLKQFYSGNTPRRRVGA
jgi:transcriptional regulator with XRE-family HTH domain